LDFLNLNIYVTQISQNRKLKKLIIKMDRIIYFNVGGKTFATNESTINSFPNSLLAIMISKQNQA